MNWRHSLLIALGVSLLLAGSTLSVAAQTPVATTTPTTFSQALRSQGLSLGDAEVAFLDADEQVQSVYVLALYNIDQLAQVEADRRNDQWRQALLTELQRLTTTDPAGSPSAPSNLQRFRELAVAYRQQVREAATKWIAAVQANDAEWLQLGIDDYRSSVQRLQAMQQELADRYPQQSR